MREITVFLSSSLLSILYIDYKYLELDFYERELSSFDDVRPQKMGYVIMNLKS